MLTYVIEVRNPSHFRSMVGIVTGPSVKRTRAQAQAVLDDLGARVIGWSEFDSDGRIVDASGTRPLMPCGRVDKFIFVY